MGIVSKGTHIPIIPPKVCEALGEDVAVELAGFIGEVAVATSASKVDRSEYDAHAKLLDEKFGRFRAEMRVDFESLRGEVHRSISNALVKGLAWVTVLIFGSVWFLLKS